MSYLLDTNVCIEAINNRPVSVRTRLLKEIKAGTPLFVPSIVLFELWYGAEKSARKEINFKLLQEFLTGPLTLLPFESGDAMAAALLRASLEISGTPIGAYDTLIAGQAIYRSLTLVTANVSEFSRVSNLILENWSSA